MSSKEQPNPVHKFNLIGKHGQYAWVNLRDISAVGPYGQNQALIYLSSGKELPVEHHQDEVVGIIMGALHEPS